MGSPGESAAEHARQLIDEAGRWAAGAEGERRVAASLASLPEGWTVVHDRLLRPGRSEANLDHIAVGPTGIYLIDAKNRAGRVTEHDGGLFQHRHRDGRVETVSLAGELKKVHGMAAYMAAESDRAVAPVLCLAGVRADEFGEPRMVRGVWVVPVAALPGWLRSRPVVMGADIVPTVATRVITDFPSTTTDPALLSAMAGDAATGRTVGRGGSRGRGRGRAPGRPPRIDAARRASAGDRPPRRSRGFLRGVSRLLLAGLLVVAFLGMLAELPAVLNAAVERLVATGTSAPSSVTTDDGATATPTAAATAAAQEGTTKGSTARAAPVQASPTKTKATKAGAPMSVPAKPLGRPDCVNASAAEIKTIIGRSVKPVVTNQGCAWGTRLDDQSTLLVTITMATEHPPWDENMTTSVKQQRVVFGGSYLSTVGRGTTASVATGQLILRGAKVVRARADTVVVIASESLGVSDDRARQMAVAIAAAANG